MARGDFRNLPWKEQPHVVQNPRFPYGIGMPQSRNIDEPNVFSVNERVMPASSWPATRLGSSGPYQIISTRMHKEFRRGEFQPQVMVADQPGQWWAASHFRKMNEHELEIR